MMLPTHAMVGLAVAAPLVVLAPDVVPAALVGALIGSVLPDLDLYAGHRRTLHYPTGYSVAAVPAAAAAALLATPVAVAAAALLVGAALHCRMDRYGGGLELRPWEGTSDRGVYDHVRGRWLAPKRWVAYDGSPGDFLFALALGVPLLVVLDGPFRWVVAAALLVGGAYAALRRRLARLAPTVFGRVPGPVREYVPARYRE
ncbi:metal-dependent hydrolase [Halostella sp. JP-L12]|uniref:metal-dependent hydrolase n=1 Tax=Halostella TaxID=1843185 RepID=UPI000EF82827|nr:MULTISPECIES: metal-dependent hydrolase [Halostella]NHN48114.1 metal-dependent hydrolase [Halostella sp. JP-L12]